MSDTTGAGSGPPSYPGPNQPLGEGQQGYPPPPPPPPGAGPPAYPPLTGMTQPIYPDRSGGYGSPYPTASPGVPPAYPGYPGGYGQEDQRPEGWNGLAIAAFFVGLLVPGLGLLIAVPLAIVALVKISGTRQKGRWLAIAGIVLSVLWVVAFVGLGFWALGQRVERNSAGEIVSSGTIDYEDIRAGDCVDIPDPNRGGNVNTFDLKGVPCSESHNAETMAVIPIAGGDYPGQAALDHQSAQPCQDAVAQTILQHPDLQPYRLLPTEGIWDGTDGHRVLCFVQKQNLSNMSGSVSD